MCLLNTPPIFRQIDRFVMELEDFKESVEGVLGEGWEEGERERGEVAGLGSVRDAVEVREEEEEVEKDVQAAVNCVKVRETVRESGVHVFPAGAG